MFAKSISTRTTSHEKPAHRASWSPLPEKLRTQASKTAGSEKTLPIAKHGE
jgi:hypothetical protein